MSLREVLLAAIGKGFIDSVATEIKEKFKAFMKKDAWFTSGGKYRDKIINTYGWTRILGKPNPIKLEGIFTDVYLLDKITAWQRFDFSKLKVDPKAFQEEQKRLSGLDLVKEGMLRPYILGKPGSGKTTFLKYIALKAANNEIRKIPIFITLKEWADSGEKLMDFMIRQFDICDFPDSRSLIEYILSTGQAIVLFDGLDETQQETGKRDEIISEIRDFSRKYSKSQIIVTCRIAATEYTFEEFTYLEIADFTREQASCYVENYFGKDSEKQINFVEEFNRSENRNLREMANTPFLLSLLCINFEETETFPNRRVEIYREGINALLHKWDSSRSIKRDIFYQKLSLERKGQMFARIAAETFAENEYFIPKHKLVGRIVDYLSQLPDAPPKEDIDGESILRAIEAQHSLLVERAKDIYSFSHLTFQEYFTAKYIIDNNGSGTLQKLLSPFNILENRWREVILNTASLLDDAGLYFQLFKQVLDGLIINYDEINDLFAKVEEKTKSISTGFSKPATRMFYTYLELLCQNHIIPDESWSNDAELGHLLNQENYNDYSFDQALSLFLNISKISELEYEIYQIMEVVSPDFSSYPFNFYRECSLIRGLNVECSVAKVMPGKLNDKKFDYIEKENDLIFDFRLAILYVYAVRFYRLWFEDRTKFNKVMTKFVFYLEETQKFYCNSIDKQAALAIKQLKCPHPKDWNLFVDDLRKIMKNQRNINHHWDMSNGNGARLVHYAKTADLFILCLKLASVSNQQALENSLFLPRARQ